MVFPSGSGALGGTGSAASGQHSFQSQTGNLESSKTGLVGSNTIVDLPCKVGLTRWLDNINTANIVSIRPSSTIHLRTPLRTRGHSRCLGLATLHCDKRWTNLFTTKGRQRKQNIILYDRLLLQMALEMIRMTLSTWLSGGKNVSPKIPFASHPRLRSALGFPSCTVDLHRDYRLDLIVSAVEIITDLLAWMSAQQLGYNATLCLPVRHQILHLRKCLVLFKF